jgi:hypothetical protein
MSGTLVKLDVASMTELLRETELRHRAYEASAAKHDWSVWYGAYVVARESGKTSDDAARDATLHVEASREHVQK